MQIEDLILNSLVNNEEYSRRVLPFLKKEYFSEQHHSESFEHIEEFIHKYNKLPSIAELQIELKSKKGLPQKVYQLASEYLATLESPRKAPELAWLLEQSEKFCQDKSLYNAIVESVSILENDSSDIPKSAIPELLKDALSVSFDSNIGHDFMNFAERYKNLHKNESRIPFDIGVLNEITSGGLPKKTLNVVTATSGAGKTLFMCHAAARWFLHGQNVLYITMEMSEERITERIDANLMNLAISDVHQLSLQDYSRRIQKVIDNNKVGRLIVKEYPTAGASVAHFRALLNELRLKKDFIPDIIIIDYINICASSRFKASAVNSYQYVKSICEELRGLAIEFDVPVFSATQTNRSGANTTDVEVTEISDSFGLVMTVDLLLAMIRSEELDEQGLVMFKQLKNRYSDMTTKLRFVTGIERSKMLLFDSDAETPEMSQRRMVVNGSPKSQEDAPKPNLPRSTTKPKRDFSGIRA